MSDIEHISVTKTINGQQVTETYDIVTSGGDANMSKATYDVSPATKAHAVDDFIYFNSHVYKVTSAISIGDSIAVGTNITADLGLEQDTQIYIDDVPGGGGGGGTGSPNFVGTTADWNALSAAEKAEFDASKGVTVNLSDDDEGNDDTGWIIVDENCRYRKKNGYVTVDWYGIPSASATWSTIGTLPDGFRPSINVYFSAWTSNATVGLGRISTDGSIGVFSLEPGATSIGFYIYITFILG